MATHSSILAWEIPWTEEPGKLLEKKKKRMQGLEDLRRNEPSDIRDPFWLEFTTPAL